MSNDNNFFDTIIIGAGISGVSTAYHLLYENNYKDKVCILEGRNRIGGRIVGQTIAGKHVELGANWIHGIINNPIYNLALKYKLIDPLKDKPDENPYDTDNVCGFIANTGEPVPISTINKAYQTYFWILKKGEDFYNRICKGEIIEEKSLGEYVNSEVENYLLTIKESERPLMKAIFNQMIIRETDVNGCNSLDDVSLRYYGLYKEFPGGHQVIPAGFSNVVQGLLDDVFIKTQENNRPDQFKLFLNHKVTLIKWSGVQTTTKEPVEITCSNGQIFKCNHVVNTMPVGYLKENIKQLYEPSLPQYKIDCVNSIGFDHINKVYVEFENSIFPEFIDASVNEIMIFWNEEQTEEERLQLCLDKTWFKKIYSFTRINDRLLLGWLSGKEAEYALKLDEQTLVKEIGNLLRKMLSNPNFPNPKAIVQTNWGIDEFTKGSYSFVRTNENGKDIEMLGQPIFSDPGNEKPILLFAGEATHHCYFSTTHGAFLTGKKQASYLLDQN